MKIPRTLDILQVRQAGLLVNSTRISWIREYNTYMRGHKSNSRDGAFTLLEVLIVVIILGVLAAIVVPLFSDASEEAELETCMANLGVIYRSMQIYELRNGQYPTSTDDLAATFPTLPTCPLAGEYTWQLQAGSYHVVCNGQHSPTISHACIRDTHGPNAR